MTTPVVSLTQAHLFSHWYTFTILVALICPLLYLFPPGRIKLRTLLALLTSLANFALFAETYTLANDEQASVEGLEDGKAEDLKNSEKARLRIPWILFATAAGIAGCVWGLSLGRVILLTDEDENEGRVQSISGKPLEEMSGGKKDIKGEDIVKGGSELWWGWRMRNKKIMMGFVLATTVYGYSIMYGRTNTSQMGI
jgi:hypothetical protein